MNTYLCLLSAAAAGLLVVACSTTASESPSETQQQEAVEDIESFVRLPDGRFEVRCRDGRREVVSADDLRANRVCGSGPIGSGVALYGRSDSCSGSPLAIVSSSTRCESLGSDSVWSVSVNGVCTDIPDTDARTACRQFQGAVGAGFQIYSRSDSCSGEVAAFVNASTNCDALGSGPAWSVKKDGVCTDISDTTVAAACRQFQGGIGPSMTIYGRSDSCSGEVAALANANTNCASLGSGAAWSVKVNDQCYDIADSTASAACEMYKGAIGPHVRIYGRSDSCSGEVTAFVGTSTRCDSLSSSAPAWSIFADGRCTDISDTNVRDACIRFGGH